MCFWHLISFHGFLITLWQVSDTRNCHYYDLTLVCHLQFHCLGL